MRAGIASFRIGTLVLLGVASSSYGQGIIVPSAGPINSAMAGASTAAPVDFGGSYWNQAILSGLDDQEVLIGTGLLFPSEYAHGHRRKCSLPERLPALLS